MLIKAVLVALILVLMPAAAEAYIDPGTGALGVQILFAAIATAIVTVKLWWSRFLALFKKDKRTDKYINHENSSENDE